MRDQRLLRIIQQFDLLVSLLKYKSDDYTPQLLYIYNRDSIKREVVDSLTVSMTVSKLSVTRLAPFHIHIGANCRGG